MGRFGESRQFCLGSSEFLGKIQSLDDVKLCRVQKFKPDFFVKIFFLSVFLTFLKTCQSFGAAVKSIYVPRRQFVLEGFERIEICAKKSNQRG